MRRLVAICFTALSAAAADIEIDVDTGNPIHVLNVPGAKAAATILNASDVPFAAHGDLILSDYWGEIARIPLDAEIAPGGTHRVPLPVPVKFGIYRLKVDFQSTDGPQPEKTVQIQREAYAGVKAGCPDAVCITAGMALPIASESRWFMRPGFHRRFMDECRDSYDVYPVHLHGDFPAYVRDLGQVLDFRRKAGLAQPWFANETSMSSAYGAEDAVAECVWQKILYSWALGSVDYIWYNLRAHGPNDGEKGYGLMTEDFHPRSGFAAFSGLVHTFGLLNADGPAAENGLRFIARWSGERGGNRQMVFGGWDLATETNCPVRVRTDARAAFAVDLFGNRSPLSVAGGMVKWEIGRTPCALLLEGAGSAEIDAADAAASATEAARSIPIAAASPEEPQIALSSFSKVVELFLADPANAGTRRNPASPDFSAPSFHHDRVKFPRPVGGCGHDDAFTRLFGDKDAFW